MANTQLTGLCGEHYVAAMLAGSGLVVALPRGGAARTDLFVADSYRGRALRVQVKAGRQSYWKYKRKYEGQAGYSWDSSTSIVNTHDESLWYAFVSLGDWPTSVAAPAVFFVPSAVVARHMQEQLGKPRTFFWSYESQLQPYRDANGIALLKAALAEEIKHEPAEMRNVD